MPHKRQRLSVYIDGKNQLYTTYKKHMKYKAMQTESERVENYIPCKLKA